MNLSMKCIYIFPYTELYFKQYNISTNSYYLIYDPHTPPPALFYQLTFGCQHTELGSWRDFEFFEGFGTFSEGLGAFSVGYGAFPEGLVPSPKDLCLPRRTWCLPQRTWCLLRGTWCIP